MALLLRNTCYKHEVVIMGYEAMYIGKMHLQMKQSKKDGL